MGLEGDLHRQVIGTLFQLMPFTPANTGGLSSILPGSTFYFKYIFDQIINQIKSQ